MCFFFFVLDNGLMCVGTFQENRAHVHQESEQRRRKLCVEAGGRQIGGNGMVLINKLPGILRHALQQGGLLLHQRRDAGDQIPHQTHGDLRHRALLCKGKFAAATEFLFWQSSQLPYAAVYMLLDRPAMPGTTSQGFVAHFALVGHIFLFFLRHVQFVSNFLTENLF